MAISNGSPLFKLPVDAVQRGRDHGLPTYNDARLVSGGGEGVGPVSASETIVSRMLRHCQRVSLKGSEVGLYT